MHILIYVGAAPSRELVLTFSAPLAEHVATALTLVSSGGREREALLHEAAARLSFPGKPAPALLAPTGDAHAAIVSAARSSAADLVILGRLNQPLQRLLPRPRSKTIAQQLDPSVLRVAGAARPIRRMLLASGGDHHTFAAASLAARLATPLGASVTLLHVMSQQSLVFEGLAPRQLSVEEFLAGSSPEVVVLREAAALLTSRNVPIQVVGRVGLVLEEILAEARRGYDLLVVGAHRASSPLDRILLEDITGDLLDVSPLPVLVVKR